MSRFPRIVERVAVADATVALPSLPPLLSRLYAARGVVSDEQAKLGLDALPAPTMKGMDAAVSALVEAIREGKRLLVVGDFDCDGATSTSLALLGLRMLGAADVDFLVPNRFEYGYGLSPEIVAVAAERRPQCQQHVKHHTDASQ